MKKFYVTTPIYYVNAKPHIGHSYTSIAADCLARYNRQRLGKDNVWFLTGTDEHGQKIQKAADEAKSSPQEFVDKIVPQFKDLWKALDISYDDFIRTTEERHIKFVQRVFDILNKKGDIYESKYEGWYCTPCETFWTELQITNNLCPDCKRPLEKISETNYFFRLSKYQGWLVKYIEEHVDFIKPSGRREEMSSFLRHNKLTDLCISRPKERLSWGIPLPFPPKADSPQASAPAHVAYVWFDALINYISAVGSFDEKGDYHSKWWEGDVNVVQLIGKDILRHHAVYWPIMLEALGIRQPNTIFAHGWWLIADTKMSKSRGNVINPIDIINQFGLDSYRYFLLRDVPFGLDGNFSEEAVTKRFNSDLANDLGNLLYRTLTMVEKYYEGNVPELDIKNARFDTNGDELKKNLFIKVDIAHAIGANSDLNFSAALTGIWEVINMANKYVEETKPWNLAKEGKAEELKAFIRLLVEVLRNVGEAISPFMPHTSGSIREQIGREKINKTNPLFPRIEQK